MKSNKNVKIFAIVTVFAVGIFVFDSKESDHMTSKVKEKKAKVVHFAKEKTKNKKLADKKVENKNTALKTMNNNRYINRKPAALGPAVPTPYKKKFKYNLFSSRLNSPVLLEENTEQGRKTLLMNGKMGKHRSFIIEQDINTNGDILSESAMVASQFVVMLHTDVDIVEVQSELASLNAMISKRNQNSTIYKVRFSPQTIEEWKQMKSFLDSKVEWFSLVSADYILRK